MEPEEPQHPQPHLFTLRVWQEDLGSGEAEWRGRVQNVASGDTVFFRDWPGLVSTLQRLVAMTPGACEEAPAEAPS
jgi:hypothetical protein